MAVKYKFVPSPICVVNTVASMCTGSIWSLPIIPDSTAPVCIFAFSTTSVVPSKLTALATTSPPAKLKFLAFANAVAVAVSYTHLTLPTILLV